MGCCGGNRKTIHKNVPMVNANKEVMCTRCNKVTYKKKIISHEMSGYTYICKCPSCNSVYSCS